MMLDSSVEKLRLITIKGIYYSEDNQCYTRQKTTNLIQSMLLKCKCYISVTIKKQEKIRCKEKNTIAIIHVTRSTKKLKLQVELNLNIYNIFFLYVHILLKSFSF